MKLQNDDDSIYFTFFVFLNSPISYSNIKSHVLLIEIITVYNYKKTALIGGLNPIRIWFIWIMATFNKL